jgi:hypothetical protein
LRGDGSLDFPDKKSAISDLYKKYSIEILNLANVPISDASILKASAYLMFAHLGVIHVLTKGVFRQQMEEMIEEVRDSVKPLSMMAGELGASPEDLRRILAEFPTEAEVDETTIVNGLAGFNGIYFAYVGEAITSISTHTGGPMGIHGYAAIRVLEGIRGKGNGGEGMIEVALKLTEMTSDLIQTIKKSSRA